MLMSTQANRYAHQLLDARARAQLIPPLSAHELLTVADGYDIARCILDTRIAQGEAPVGHKIGFTNRKIWSRYGVTAPIHMPVWTPMLDSTVRYVEDNHAIQSLAGALQPRGWSRGCVSAGQDTYTECDLGRNRRLYRMDGACHRDRHLSLPRTGSSTKPTPSRPSACTVRF